MRNKFLLILIFVFILSISTVNAQDNITKEIIVNNEPANHDILNNYQSSSEIGNFTDLNDEISKISPGGNLTLQKDYKYDSNDSAYKNGIKITKDNIIIDGAGYTIDGAGQARIFNISSNNVTLKNIIFANGYSTENGGAIFTNTSLNIINSTFIHNTAKLGGAIYIESNFADCKINSTFINNNANSAGAIYFNRGITNITLTCYFEQNTAKKGGGAIFVKGTSKNNKFISNFYNNSVDAASGGGIFFYRQVENNLFECIFRHNTADYGAGIFFYNKSNNNNFKCDFIFNTARSCGGAMFFYYTTNNNNFTGCFISNSALGLISSTNGNGGAITFKNSSSNSIFTCDFINNTAAIYGGGINYRETVENITFNSNFINNTGGNGGGVNFFKTFENIKFNGEFIGNTALNGGAIAGGSGSIKDTTFRNNHAKTGGAISLNGNGYVTNCEFTSNNAEDGGAILTYENLTITNSRFENNTAALGTNHISLKRNGNATLINTTPEDLGPYHSLNLTVLNISTVRYGESVKITLKVTYDNGLPLNNGTILIIINNNKYTETVDNGHAEITIPNLNAGSYNTNVTYMGNNYLVSSPVQFTVLKQNATITAKNKAYIINYGGKYSITLKDAKGNALNGKTVTFTLNGKNIKSTITDVNGAATIALTTAILKTAKAGNKKLVIKFGDSNYNTISKTVKITINKEKTKIAAKNKKFKKSTKVKKYAISLKNSKGQAIKKATVTLKVKGKTYKAKTNTKGKAIFKITKLTKKGNFKATVKFAANSYYTAVSKNVKIIIK